MFLKVCFIHIRERGKHVEQCVSWEEGKHVLFFLSIDGKKEKVYKIVFHLYMGIRKTCVKVCFIYITDRLLPLVDPLARPRAGEDPVISSSTSHTLQDEQCSTQSHTA